MYIIASVQVCLTQFENMEVCTKAKTGQRLRPSQLQKSAGLPELLVNLWTQLLHQEHVLAFLPHFQEVSRQRLTAEQYHLGVQDHLLRKLLPGAYVQKFRSTVTVLTVCVAKLPLKDANLKPESCSFVGNSISQDRLGQTCRPFLLLRGLSQLVSPVPDFLLGVLLGRAPAA